MQRAVIGWTSQARRMDQKIWNGVATGMRAILICLSGLPAQAQTASSPERESASGAWLLLQYFYPGPTIGRRVDYWGHRG